MSHSNNKEFLLISGIWRNSFENSRDGDFLMESMEFSTPRVPVSVKFPEFEVFKKKKFIFDKF